MPYLKLMFKIKLICVVYFNIIVKISRIIANLVFLVLRLNFMKN